MKRILFASAVFLAPFAAFAQQPVQQSPNEQALATRLTAEINNNLTCTAQVITLNNEIKKLQAELADAKKADTKEKKK